MKGIGSAASIGGLLFLTVCAFATCAVPLMAIGGPASAQSKHLSLIEKSHFDWDHTGTTTTFSLVRTQANSVYGGANRLIIRRAGKASWSLTNRDDLWAPISETELAGLRGQNLVPTSKRLFFVSPSSTHDAHVYLILKGAGSGCCVGSLTVLTPGDDGEPKVVFYASRHLIAAITPTDDQNSLQLIGQSSDSEARALKNAESYDPYRVYLLTGDRPAKYELALSKAYTIAHYCQGHGPKYDERFVAVGSPTGSDRCRVMTDKEFGPFQRKYPQLFPEP
jgi:hypothetical protein